MEQGPPAVKEKPHVDLFDAILNGVQKDGPGFDPIKYLYTMGRDQRRGLYTVGFDENAAFERHKETPLYKGKEDKLKEDIASAKILHDNLPGSRVYASQYKPPTNYMESLGIWPSEALTHTRLRTDPYRQHLPGGQTMSLGSNTEMGGGRSTYIDQYGAESKWGRDDWRNSGRMRDDQEGMDVIWRMETGPDGDIMAPILKERPAGEVAFGRETVSNKGAQPMDRNFLLSAPAAFVNTATFFQRMGMAAYDNTWGENSKKRLHEMTNAYRKYAAPSKYDTYSKALSTGLFAPDWISSQDPGNIKNLSEEKLFSLIEHLQSDEPKLRERAKDPFDVEARSAVSMLDMYEGVYGHGTLDRLIGQMEYVQNSRGFAASVREQQQGPFGGLEGVSGFLGNMAGFLTPQTFASKGLAGLALKTGSRAFVTQSVASGLGRVLTPLGRRTVQGLAAGVPSIQQTVGVYQGARAVGYNERQAGYLSLALSPLVYATEAVMSTSYMFKSMVASGGRKSMVEMVERSLGRELPKSDPAFLRNKAFTLYGDMMRWMKQGSEGALMNRVKNMAEPAWHEGVQETLEEMGNALGEHVTDEWTDKHYFAEKNPSSLNYGTRFMQSFLGGAVMGGVMGGMLGGKRQPGSYDRTITAAVADGKAGDILKLAKDMAEKSAITPEEFTAIQQDVEVAQQIIKGMNVADPHFLQHLQAQEDLTRMYAVKSADVLARTKQLEELTAALGQPNVDKATIEREIANLQEKQKADKAVVQDILDGTEAVRRLKNSAMAVGAARADDPAYFTADAVDAMSRSVREYITHEKERIQTGSKLRGELMPGLGGKLTELLGAKTKQVPDILAEIKGIHDQLIAGKALTREDLKHFRQAIKAKREGILMELMALPIKGAEGEAVDLNIGKKAAAAAEGMGMDPTEYVEKELSNELRSTGGGSFGQDAQDLFQNLEHVNQARASMGDTEEQFGNLSSMMPSQKRFEGGSDTDLLLDRLSSAISGNHMTDLRERLSTYRQMQSATPEHVAELKDLLQQAELALRSFDAYRGPLSEMAERVNGSELQRIVSQGREGSVPKAFKDLDADNREVYQVAARTTPEQQNALRSLVGDLRKEYLRLEQAVERRAGALADLDERTMAIKAELFDRYLKARVSKEKATDLVDAYAEFRKAQEEGNAKRVRELVARIETLISRELLGHPDVMTEMAKSMLDGLGLDNNLKAYYDTSWNKSTAFLDYYTPEVFTSKDQGEHRKAAAQITVNWLSELARTDRASLLASHQAVLNGVEAAGMLPNTDQQRRILEVASFLNNPSQSLTDALVLAGGGDKNTWTKGASQRSILFTGSQGVGKSAAIPFIVETLFGLKKSDKKQHLKIMVFAPGHENRTAIHGRIREMNPLHTVTVHPLERVGSIAEARDADLIIIDEAHAIDKKRLGQFREALKKNGVTPALYLGDHNQVSSLDDPESVLPAQHAMLRTLPLTVSFRHGDVESITTLDLLEPMAYQNIYQQKEGVTLPSTRYTEDHSAGVHLVNTSEPNDIVDMFGEHLLQQKGKQASLIVLNGKDRDAALQRLGQNTDLLGVIPAEALGKMVRTMDAGPHSILGAETPTAFIAFNGKALGTSYARFLYTAMGRATDSSVAMLAGGISKPADQLGQVARKFNDSKAIWDQTRKQTADAVRGAGPAPVKAAEKTPEKPKPFKDAKWAEGTELYIKPLFVASESGQAFAQYVNQPGRVIGSGPNGSVRISFPGDLVIEVPENALQSKSPITPKPEAPPAEEKPEEEWKDGEMFDGTPMPLIEQAKEDIDTRLSLMHTPTQRWVGVFPGTLPYPKLKEGEKEVPKQFDKTNPAFVFRMKLLELIASEPGLRYKLVYRREGKYYGAKNGFEGHVFEVHLQDAEPYLEFARKQMAAKYPAMTTLPENPSMVASVALNTYAVNGSFAGELNRLRALTATLQDGETPKGYEDLPIVSWMDGLYIEPKGENRAETEFTVLKQTLDGKAAIVSDPLFAEDAWQYTADDPTSAMPGIYIEVQAFAGAPATKVLLHTKSATADYYKGLREEIAQKLAETKGVNRRQAEKTKAYQFMLYNSTRLKDVDGMGFRNKALSEYLVINTNEQGKQYINFNPEHTYAERLKALSAVLDILEKRDPSLTMVARKALKTQGKKGFDQIMPEDHSILMSSTYDVHMPVMLLDFGSVQAAKNTVPTGGLVRGIRGRKRRKKGTATDGQRRRAVTEAEKYYRRVFGDKWVEGKLEFKATVTDEFGRELWGIMENGRIALERLQGTIVAGVERHEAVHRVLDYLLDDQTKSRLLYEAQEKLAEQKGIRTWQVSEEDAHEYIAERYEDQKFEKEPGLLQRFLRWLKAVMKRWGLHRDRIDDLLWQIEEGRFRDAEELHGDPVVRHSRKKLDQDDEQSMPMVLKSFGDLETIQRQVTQEQEPTQEQKRVSGFRDRMVLSRIFGPDTAAHIVAEAAYNLTVNGPYQAPTKDSVTLSLPSLKASAEHYWSLIKEQADKVDPHLELQDGRRIHFDQLSTAQVIQLSDDDYDAYRFWQMGKQEEGPNGTVVRPVYNSIVQAVFPNIDVERFMSAGTWVDTEGDYHTDMDAMQGMSAMVHDTMDTVNPFDRASGLTKLLLSNMRLVNRSENGDTESALQERVNLDLLLKVGMKAAQGIVFGAKAGETLQQAFARSVKALHEEDMVKRKGVKTVYSPTTEGKHAYSLYKRFLDPTGSFTSGSGHTTYSYAYLQEQGDRLLKEAQSDTDAFNAMSERIAMAERVNNNVVRFFLEISSGSNMLSEFSEGQPYEDKFTGKEEKGQGRLKHQLMRFDGTDQVRQDINEATDRLLSPRGNTDITVDPDMRGRFIVGLPSDQRSDNRLRYEITPALVQASDGTVLVRFGKESASLVSDDIELLNGFFRAAGYTFSAGTLERLTSGGTETPEVKHGLLGRAIGAWAATIYTAIHQNETKAVPAAFSTLIAKEREKGAGTRTRAEIHGNYEAEEGVGQEPLPAISDLFALNGALARQESRSQGSEYSRRFMNVHGDAEQSDTLGNYLKRMFPSLGLDLYASKAVENHAETLLQNDPGLMRAGKWLNPLPDKDASARISEVFFFKGLRTLDRGRSVDPRSMTDLDSERVMLDHFMNTILENHVAERIFVPGHPYGDRNTTPVWRLDSMAPNGARMFNLLKNENGKGYASVKYNHAVSDRWIAQQFIYHKNLQEQSLQRWSQALGVMPEEVVQAIKDMGSDPDLLMAVQSSPDFMLNRDYVIKGKQLLPGNAVKMNIGVYTEANHAAIQAAASQGAEALRAAVEGIFRPHIDAYRNRLMGEGGLQWAAPGKARGHQDQLLEGYVYLHHLVDAWTSQVLGGPLQNYKNGQDWTKRSVMPMSPGHLGLFKATPRIAFVQDPEMPEGQAKLFDGQGWTTPWGYLLGREAFGGPEGVMRETMNKRAYVASDLIVKYAEVLVSPQYYRQNEYVKGLIQRSLTMSAPSLLKTDAQQILSREKTIMNEMLDRAIDLIPKFIDTGSWQQFGIDKLTDVDLTFHDDRIAVAQGDFLNALYDESTSDLAALEDGVDPKTGEQHDYRANKTSGKVVMIDDDDGVADDRGDDALKDLTSDFLDAVSSSGKAVVLNDLKSSSLQIKRALSINKAFNVLKSRVQEINNAQVGDHDQHYNEKARDLWVKHGRDHAEKVHREADSSPLPGYEDVERKTRLEADDADNIWGFAVDNLTGTKERIAEYESARLDRTKKLNTDLERTKVEFFQKPLLGIWNSNIGETADTFWKAAQAVIDKANELGLQNELIHVISSHHNVKMGLRAVNLPDGNQPLQSIPIDPRNWVLQTNLERSLTDLRAPYPTQITAIMGLLPHNADRSERLRTLEGLITDRFVLDMVREAQLDVNDDQTQRRRKLSVYMKNAALEATADRGDVGQLVEALMDPQTAVNDPVVKRKLIQVLANRLNTRGINPKLNGQMFNQASGHGLMFALPTETTDGRARIPEEVQSGKTGDEASPERDLERTQSVDERGSDTTIQEAAGANQAASTSTGGETGVQGTGSETADAGRTTAETLVEIAEPDRGVNQSNLRPPRLEGGKYVPGDVVLPFVHAREFGFKGDEWKHLSLAQIREDIFVRLGQEAVDQFEKSLTVYVSRTPSSNVSGGHVMKIVEFINDSGNTIFIPPDLNNYTGADQDGDQLTVLFHQFGGGANNILDPQPQPSPEAYQEATDDERKEDLRALQNSIRDNLLSYYLDEPKNAPLFFMQTGTKRMEAIYEKMQAEIEADPLEHTPHMPLASLVSRRAVYDGSSIIGIVAQAIKGYSFLSQAYNKAIGTDAATELFGRWTPTEKDSAGNYVIDNLSELLNASLDNVKLMLLGPLGINPDNIPVLIGSLLRGATLEDAIAAVNDPDAKLAVKRIRHNASVTMEGYRKKNVSVADAFEEIAGTIAERRAMKEGGFKTLTEMREKLTAEEYESVVENHYMDVMKEGNRMSGYESAALFQAVSDITRIFNLNVNGLPVDESEIIGYRYKTEKTLGTTWGGVSGQQEQGLVKAEKPSKTEALVGSFFDSLKVIRSIQNISSFLGAANFVDELFRTAFLKRHPVMIGFRNNMLGMLGREGVWPGDTERVFDRAQDDFLVSFFVNKRGMTSVPLNDDLPPIDLSNTGGQYRFTAEFPRFWNELTERVMRLPENDPRRKEYLSNEFVTELRTTSGLTPRLEVKDGRRFSDPVARDLMRRDVMRMADIFTGEDLVGKWEVPILKRLALYSLLKDGFSYNQHSILPFLPVEFTGDFGRFVEEIVSDVNNPKGEGAWTMAGTGEQTTFRRLLNERLAPALSAYYTELVPKGSEKKPPAGSEYFKKSVKTGLRRELHVFRSDAPDKRVVPMNSRLAPPVSVTGPSVGTDIQSFRNLDLDTHLKLLRGESVTMQTDKDQGIKPGPLFLPTGMVATVSEVSKDGKSITLSVPSPMIGQGSLDQEPSGSFHDTFIMDGNTENYHGRENRKLDGLSLTDALARTERLSQNPQYAAIAERVLEHQRKSPRSSTVTIVDAPGGKQDAGGYIDQDGNIQINHRNSAFGADVILLHEAGHRFTRDVFEKDYASLTPQEKIYVDGMNAVYAEVKRLLPDEKMHYLSDIKEFATAGWTSPAFQQKLQSLAVPDTQETSFWDRVVNLFRALIGMGPKQSKQVPRNGFVSRIMDLTDGYVTYATDSGNTFNDTRSEGGQFNPDIHSHGMRAEMPPVTDIRDIAMRLRTVKDASQTTEQMEQETLAKHVFKRVDWMRRSQKAGGQVFETPLNPTPADKAAVLKHIRDVVVPAMRSYAHRRKDQLVGVLNSGASIEKWHEVFQNEGKKMDTDEDVRLFLSAIDHRAESVYLRYSDLKDPAFVITKQDGTTVKVGDLGIAHVPMFEGYDPILSVRKGEYGTNVNMVEFSTESLKRRPPGKKTEYLLTNYLPGTMINHAVRNHLRNDAGGIRSLLMGMQVMALKQTNPALAFPRLKVVAMNGGGFSEEGVNMDDMVRQIKTLRDLTALPKELPDGIKGVLNDEKLYQGLNYGQSWVASYADDLYNGRISADTIDSWEHLRLKDAHERYMTSPETNRSGYYAMLVNRQAKLAKLYGGNTEKLEQDNEYKTIAYALYQVDNKDVIGLHSDIDINMYQQLFNNPVNMESPVVQWGKQQIKTSNSKVAMLSKREHEAHVAEMKPLEEIAGIRSPEGLGRVTTKEFYLELGWKRFENCWRSSATSATAHGLKVYDPKTGELVKANLNILHVDEHDPETAQLLRDGKLTRTELDYNNKFADRIHRFLVDLMIHRYKMEQDPRHTGAGVFREHIARKDAEKFVAERWRRGWVPIVSRGKGEAAMQLQLNQLLKAMNRQLSNIDSLYEDDFHRTGEHDPWKVANRYLAELDSRNPSEIGGDTRLERMGIRERDDGRLELDDRTLNDGSTRNLEVIGTYFTVAAHRQMIHESETLPVVNAALGVLHAMKQENGKGQERNLAFLQDYARRLVYGEAPANSGTDVLGIPVAPLAKGLMTLTTYGGVALNWKVAAASLMYNNMAFWSTANSNDIAGNGRFGMKAARQAVKECTVANPKGNKKMRALMVHLFVNEMQEGDILSNERYSKTGSQVFTSHGMQFMNWWGDYMIRGNVMAAQMIQEGSWDAYSLNDKGEVVYDQYKDRRWYKADGTKEKDADVKMAWVRDRVHRQGIFEQPEKGPLKVGHDTEMGRVFKALADKYVIGGVDASEKVMANSYLWGQFFLQFRQFLPAKIYNWQGKRIAIRELGELNVKDGIAVWEAQEIQSYVGAFVKMFKLAADAKELGLKESFKRFDKADKFALAKMGHDMAMLTMMWVLYAGLKSAADEDKKRRRRGGAGQPLLYDNRVLTLFQQGAFDNVGGSALGLAYMAGKPQSWMPAFGTGYRMATQVFGGNPERLLDNIPGKKTFDIIADQTTEAAQ